MVWMSPPGSSGFRWQGGVDDFTRSRRDDDVGEGELSVLDDLRGNDREAGEV